MSQWDQIVARQHTRMTIKARSPYIGPGAERNPCVWQQRTMRNVVSFLQSVAPTHTPTLFSCLFAFCDMLVCSCELGRAQS